MRIVGYLDRPGLKVTVFKMDTRITIKFENGQLEQTYKFRLVEHLSNLSAIDQLVDEAFLSSVQERFLQMQRDFGKAMQQMAPSSPNEELPDIL